MKTRKSTLELTPLLDVVLIILFVFMILLANSINEGVQARQQAAEAESDLDAALQEAAGMEDELALLQEENDRLLMEGSQAEQELENQKEIFDEQQQTAENLAQAVADFIDANEDDIKKLLDDNEAPSQEMLDAMSAAGIAEELLKYGAISSKFYFIDIELKTKNNRLYINGESTTIGITLDDVGSTDKVDEIKNLIENDLEQRQGGSQMVFVTLLVKDREVRQYAWQVVWDAIGEVQEKYGTGKVFRTHITLVEE